MASSLWEEFKDLFKTNEQKAKEKQEKINSAVHAEEEIIGQLKALEDEYNASLPKDDDTYDLDALFPKDSGLKEIEYTPRTDEDIVNSAQNQVGYDKKLAKDDVEAKFLSAQKALEEGKSQAKEYLYENYENLAKLYDDLREKAHNDTLKRGLARSSVATTRLDDLSKAQASAVGEQQDKYVAVVADIDENIANLQKEKDTALENVDIRFAVELDNKINDLKAERDKTVKEYEKYNNSVREQNAKYERQRQEDIDDFLKQKEKEKQEAKTQQEEYEKKYGYSGEKLENYAKRYEIAYDFYTSLSPDIAVAALQASPNMKYYLGNMYDKLLSTLKSQSSSSSKQRIF